ncbi:quinone oxidoreductase [Leptolyngbya sp. FACHB-321]|uniref:quinone oxidoreductase family protein n=1 Tax=Leptolyngbya sp. FACHB-321 TaxID=2692807 RepID=UPI0016855885|nr:quinone oxidoreductase [Leptolyngbya sp. FACHB-321]MBD2034547.1 quinone oxidoreductase [Leptolyngbya sp. FACHB-321]
MKTHAVQIHEFGAPEVLRYEEVELPEPGSGEVRLLQTAIGVNFLDVYFRKGDFSGIPLPFTPGHEGVGVVEAIGEGVTAVQVGDRVAYQLVSGSYTHHRNIHAERLVPLPAEIDEVQASAMMLKGMTAEYLVRQTYPVKPGDTILIHAVAGGVGLILSQWAKHLGATVIRTVSSEVKADFVKGYGCDYPIVYTKEDFAERVKLITDGAGVPVVYDGVGQATFLKSLDCLQMGGQMVLFGWSSGKVPPFDLHSLNAKSLSVTNPGLQHYTATRQALLNSAAALFDVVSQGIVKIEVNHAYALEQAIQAHHDLEGRKTTGSIALIP